MSEERWLPVVGFECAYEVSDLGRVRSLPRMRRTRGTGQYLAPGTVMRQETCRRSGYQRIQLCREGRYHHLLVHRMVLEAFVGLCPDGEECRHRNGVRTHNRLENLEWGTRSENCADRVRHGTAVRGERSPNSKLTAENVRRAREQAAHGRSVYSLAQEFGVSWPTMNNAISRKTWACIE